MPRQLSADCLNEIFEYLENDKITLRSCLLVNCLYCRVAVRILWRNVWNFQYNVYGSINRAHLPLSIISTLIACLPKKSKDLLRKNGIITPTWKPPIFNYASFCKVLSIHGIDQMVQHVLENQQIIFSGNLNYSKYLLSQEILKLFMNQISSLKSLDYYSGFSKKVQNIMFISLPEAKNCLADLTELNCSSDIYSEFFYQISQICHHIQSLTIEFEENTSEGLIDLISLQNNLKSVTLKSYDKDEMDEIEGIASSLSKFSSTLTKLEIKEYYIPLSFIAVFTNLQELTLSFEESYFEGFDVLQHVTFPQLKVLKFLYTFPVIGTLMKFLEINGKGLTEFYLGEHDDLLNLAVAKSCPNLKTLTIFIEDDLETLKLILNNCQYLESIRVQYGVGCLDKRFLEILSNDSPKDLNKLQIDYYERSITFLEELEEFLVNWKNRTPLSLMIITDSSEDIDLEVNGKETRTIIEKYMKTGAIKKYMTRKFDDEEY